MREIIGVIMFVCFSITVLQVSRDLQHTNYRTLASVPESNNDVSCLDSLSSFLGKGKNAFSSLSSQISKMSLKVRYKVLLALASPEKVSDQYYFKYAKFLNDAIEKNDLEVSEVEQMLSGLKTKGFDKLFVAADGKVYSNVDHLMAGTDELDRLQGMIYAKNFTPEDATYLVTEMFELNLSRAELKIITELLSKDRDVKDVETVTYFVRYLRGVRPAQYPEALEDMKNLFAMDSTSKYLKEFRKYKATTDKKGAKFLKSTEKKIAKAEPGLSSDEIARKALTETRQYTRAYDKLYFSCKAKTQNIDRMSTNKKLLRSMLAFEVVSGVSAFAVAHRDDPKDGVYWRKLAFDMGVSLPWVALRSNVASAPTISMKAAMATDYILGSVLDIFPTLVVYQQQFGVKDKDIEKQLQDMVRSDDFQVYLKKVINVVESEGVHEGKSALLKSLNLNDIEQLASGESLSNEQTEEVLREAIAREIYLSRKGKWLDTGTVGMDVFIYNKVWGTQSSMRNIALAFWMYHILCTGQLNPKKAFMLTFALYSANKAFNAFGYQYFRKEATGH